MKTPGKIKKCVDSFIYIPQICIIGKKLLIKTSTVPHECVEPKCTELNRVRTALSDKITKRLETLDKWRELMEQVERVI